MMLGPLSPWRWQTCVWLACLLPASLLPVRAATKATKSQGPALRFPFEDLGIPGVSMNFLNAGGSLMTVNFLDNSHLLVTFGTRGLVPRLVDDPVTDDDRMVGGEIVELPSGKVLARTEWRLHDHGRYLWSLGKGRFLLRMGNELSSMAPLANLKAQDPFQRTSFGAFPARPSAVLVSPDGAIVTVELELKPDPAEERAGAGPDASTPLGDPEPPQKKVLAAFYRVDGEGGVSPVRGTSTGMVKAESGFVLPADSDGYLWATDRGRGEWSVNFDGFGGKQIKLGEVVSSCAPNLNMVSRSEFLVLSCRGSDDNLKLSAYGFDGHETWEEPFSGFSSLAFAFAPTAGRFAMSRVTAAAVPAPGMPADMVSGPGQELRVYQMESGDLLLRVKTSPVFRTAENFDLSPDGMAAVVVRERGIEIYRLPEPSKRDREDMAEVEKFAPPASRAFSIARIAQPIEKAAEAPASDANAAAPSTLSADKTETPAPPATAGGVRQASDADAAPTGDSGDGSGLRRRPPTLLNPGETPEISPKTAAPQ